MSSGKLHVLLILIIYAPSIFSLSYSIRIYGITVWGGAGTIQLNRIVTFHNRMVLLMVPGCTAQSFTTFKLLTFHDIYINISFLLKFVLLSRGEIVIFIIFFQIIFLITITQQGLWLMLNIFCPGPTCLVVNGPFYTEGSYIGTTFLLNSVPSVN